MARTSVDRAFDRSDHLLDQYCRGDLVDLAMSSLIRGRSDGVFVRAKMGSVATGATAGDGAQMPPAIG